MKKFLIVGGNAEADKQSKEMGCPLNLSVIPNYMGINLCSVDCVEWEVRDDNSLVNFNIVFKESE